MPVPRPSRAPTKTPAGRSLMFRLDDECKTCLAKAARLRGISLSDYARAVTVPQARREILAARDQTLAMIPAEQLEFWIVLAVPLALTESQTRFGALMRGEE